MGLGSDIGRHQRDRIGRGLADFLLVATPQQVPGALVAALVMGAAISGMHYCGMAAADFSVGSVCLSAGQLRGEGLGVLVPVTTIVLLSLALLTAIVDARLQSRSVVLAASLQAANNELHQLAFRDALTELHNRLLLYDRVAVEGHELRLSCSVGIAMYPCDGPCDQLMAHADAAMYTVKRAGGSAYAFYEPHMHAGAR